MFAPKMLARHSAVQYRALSVGKWICCMGTVRLLSSCLIAGERRLLHSVELETDAMTVRGRQKQHSYGKVIHEF